MTWTSTTKPATVYSNNSKPTTTYSSVRSVRNTWEDMIYSWENTLKTWDEYSNLSYTSINKPT
jgi:hypothetical protein